MKKTKLIPKHQIGKKILNFITAFGNAQIAGDSGAGAAAAAASGYQYNPKTRKWEQSKENLKESENLRNNLAVLSTFSPTHPATALIEKAVIPGVVYIGGKMLKPIFNKYTFNSFKNITLNSLRDKGIITQQELDYLKNLKIQKGNTFSSSTNNISVPQNYHPKQDGGFSLFHELGHQLGNKRGQEFLEQFYNQYGRGYQYSFKLPKGIDKLARNQDELFADYLGFKVGGNKSLNIDKGNMELLGRRNHFRNFLKSEEELLGVPKHNRTGDLNKSTFVSSYGNDMGTIDIAKQSISGKSFGDIIAEGSEQIVYNNISNPKTVLKIYNDIGHKDLKSLLKFNKKEYLPRNNVPFQIESNFIGYVKDKNGLMYPVYQQQKMQNLLNQGSKEDWMKAWREIHLPAINKQLNSTGYKGDGTYWRGSRNIGDINPGNVAIRNNKYWFIDAYPMGFKFGGKLNNKYE